MNVLSVFRLLQPVLMLDQVVTCASTANFCKAKAHFDFRFPPGFLQIVVDFTASWCGPCKLMAPVFAELSRKFGQLIFVKVDVDEVQVLIPTVETWIKT